MDAKLQPRPAEPKSPAHLMAVEAFEKVQEVLHGADKAIKEALAQVVPLEAQLPGDGAHPLATLIHARESVVSAQRAVEGALQFGLDSPIFGNRAMLGEAPRMLDCRGPR
jgi:hypothetical protein